MKISPAKISSLLWIEKAAILPVVLAASKDFFRGECGASTTGDTCECPSIKKKKKENTMLPPPPPPPPEEIAIQTAIPTSITITKTVLTHNIIYIILLLSRKWKLN